MKTDLAGQILAKALRLDKTVGVAESLTGGWLASSIVAVPGSSAIFRGGVVAYSNRVKHELLHVDSTLLSELGPVNQAVASSMAEGAVQILGVDIAVATTGLAGPGDDFGTSGTVGTVFIGVAGSRLGTMGRRLDFEGDRTEIRSRAVTAALQAILDALESWT